MTSPKIDIEGQGFQQQEVQGHRRDSLCHWSRLAFEFLVSSVIYVLTLRRLWIALQYLHGDVSGTFLSCFKSDEHFAIWYRHA